MKVPQVTEKSIKKHLINLNFTRTEMRKSVISKLGNVCVICGFSDYRALQIDHINGGGSKHRKSFSSNISFLRDVLKDNGTKYQLLCANCNWIKRFQNNETWNGRK